MADCTLATATRCCPARREAWKGTNAGPPALEPLFAPRLGSAALPGCHAVAQRAELAPLSPLPLPTVAPPAAPAWVEPGCKLEQLTRPRQTQTPQTQHGPRAQRYLRRFLSPWPATAALTLTLAQWRRRRGRNGNRLPGEGGTVSPGNIANLC